MILLSAVGRRDRSDSGFWFFGLGVTMVDRLNIGSLYGSSSVVLCCASTRPLALFGYDITCAPSLPLSMMKVQKGDGHTILKASNEWSMANFGEI